VDIMARDQRGRRYTNDYIPDTSVEAACMRKARFHSKAIARIMRDRARKASGDNEIRVYECGYCRGYHLTSMSRAGHRGVVRRRGDAA
jgi:hypothetical protein